MAILDSPDFWYGVLSVSGLAVVRWLRAIHVAPAVATVQKLATTPVPYLGNDEVITVWGFDKSGCNRDWNQGVSDQSPFVCRVEAYLRLIRKPYVKEETKGLRENPRGKVPIANVKGIMVDDSTRIIETIKNTFGITVDDKLTPEQRTQGYLIQQLLQHSLYWVLLHQNFGTELGRTNFSKEFAKLSMPGYMKFLLTKMIYRKLNGQLCGSGYGLIPAAELVKRGQADIRALSSLLKDNKYILGTSEATSYDSDVYSFVSMLFFDTNQSAFQWVTEIKEECLNLVEYVKRMRKLLYPELHTN
jgi:glutathione S-transferase